MTKLLFWVVSLVTVLVAAPAAAQEVDAEAVSDVAEALQLFNEGAWLLGVAIVARVLSSVTKGFNPLWQKLQDKPEWKWVHPASMALLTALATAPLLTDNWIVVVVVSVGAALLSGFTAVGWYHGPTWIGGNPSKHATQLHVEKSPPKEA